MASQSGIQPNAKLQQAWTEAISSEQPRVLKISIVNEELIASDSVRSSADFASDFTLLSPLLEPNTSAYLLYRLDPPSSSSFILYSYVPDSSPVRQKMLYASTRATLVKFLTPSKLHTTIHASSPDELTHQAWLAYVKSQEKGGGRTAREEEIERLKEAEAAASQEGQEASPLFGEGKGRSGWTEGAVEAVKEFLARGTGEAVRLEIDAKESVALSDPQPSGLQIREDAPSYTFYHHPRGVVFIYACPTASKVKSRMVHSSAARGTVHVAESLGLKVLKRLETSDPEEVTDAWIDDALGPVAPAAELNSLEIDPLKGEPSPPSSGMMTPTAPLDRPEEGKAFAKPARPGRRR